MDDHERHGDAEWQHFGPKFALHWWLLLSQFGYVFEFLGFSSYNDDPKHHFYKQWDELLRSDWNLYFETVLYAKRVFYCASVQSFNHDYYSFNIALRC